MAVLLWLKGENEVAKNSYGAVRKMHAVTIYRFHYGLAEVCALLSAQLLIALISLVMVLF